jgi:hypothetical protein
MGDVSGIRSVTTAAAMRFAHGRAYFNNEELLKTLRLEAVSYFFFRFRRGSLKGPLIPSATASRARRSNSAGLFFRGKANGWPRFHSVGLRLDFLVCLAMRSLSHVYGTFWSFILSEP